MAKGGLLGSQNPLWGNTPTNLQQGAANQVSGATGAFKQWLDPFASKGMSMVTPGSTDYQNLWNMTAQNFKNQMAPQLAGAGVLTSGPGLNVMSEGLRNLSTQFTSDQLQNFMKMLGLTGGLESGVPGMYSSLLGPMFSQGTSQAGVQQLFGNLGSKSGGGSGLMGLFSGGGGGGGAGPLMA